MCCEKAAELYKTLPKSQHEQYTKITNSSLTTLASSSGLTSSYVKNGTAVNVAVTGNHTGTIAAWGSVGLGTLPSEIRPKVKQCVRLIDGFMLVIQTSGAIQIQNASSSAVTHNSGYGIEGSVTFLV